MTVVGFERSLEVPGPVASPGPRTLVEPVVYLNAIICLDELGNLYSQ
jgi:hypothetical protein